MTVLELGVGNNPVVEDAVHHDRTKHGDHIDVAWDLAEMPWPWKDEEFSRVVAVDVMEHLKYDVQVWLDECWRILEPNGQLELRLPAWDNPLSYRDPTHQRVFHEESFYYWDPRTNLYDGFGSYYFAESNRWWHVNRVLRESNDLRFSLTKLLT